MSQYGLIADIHASDRPPSSCTDSYLDDLLDLLAQTVRIASERRLRAVVWAGDIFHSKTPGRTSHKLVQRLAVIAGSYPCPLYIVPGNHDIQYDRLDTIPDTQPLGVLLRTPNAYPLIGWDRDGVLYGVPWQQKWDDESVLAALHSWRNEKRFTDGRLALVVAHAPLYPPGQELKWEHFPATRWADAMGGKGSCFYGHVHEPHGIWHIERADSANELTAVEFCNNGALSRGSLHEYNLTRQVGMTLWSDSTGEFEFVPLLAKPADQVFRLKEKQEVTDMHGRLDDFLASVGSTTLQVVSAETVIAHIKGLDLPAGDAELAGELIAWAAAQ